jgi:hypothetical protein
MWILMDSYWQSQTHELLVKLRQNLPLTIATTIVMSLLVGFWKTLLHFAKRSLGLIEPAKEPIRPYLPEGEIAHTYTADKFRHGFTVGWGWRAALVDAGVVQCELEPRRYRSRAVARMIAKMGLGENARAIVWRDKEFPVNLYLADLFARDHQPMQVEIHTYFRIDAARLMRSSLEELTQPPEEISKHISAKVALPAQQWISSMDADDFYHQAGKLSEWSDLAKSWVRLALGGSAFEVIRITDLRIFSPALDQVFKEYGDMALENEAARREVERNKVRGALRQAVLEGKLEEVHDQAEHEDTVRAIEQERSLKEKALHQELAQAEVTELEEKLRVWRRKHELLLQALDPVPGGAQGGGEVTQRVAENLRRSTSDAFDSPFSAFEREQIREVLQSNRAQTARPDEILSAIAKGGDIPCSLFDPLMRIRGSHTLRIGDGWRIFDGASLWQIRLTRIMTRRHGFLWLRESPAQAHFEVRGSPDKRQFEQDVILGKPFELTVGPHAIPVEYLGGTPSRISLRIPADSRK